MYSLCFILALVGASSAAQAWNRGSGGTRSSFFPSSKLR